MFGPPIIPPPNAIILRPHWRYKIKQDGTRSARECFDGSPRAAPELHQDAITYASCIELPCMRLFFSLAAVSNYFVLLTDAVNAYANARGPTKPTYIRVDAAYADWYLTRTGISIPPGSAVLAQHALQGHPEAGRLFEELANDILLNRLGLTTTSHERNLYCGIFESHKVYVCRQVDDLAISAPTIDIGQRLIAAIGSHVTLAGNSLLIKFNGIQVEQSREYIRLHCTDYIDRLVERYGWSTPSTPDSSHFTAKEPMNATVYKQLDSDTGPPEHSPEGLQLAQSTGFSYRALLGTLIYAYVICRLDIGYALTKLSNIHSNQLPFIMQHSNMLHSTYDPLVPGVSCFGVLSIFPTSPLALSMLFRSLPMPIFHPFLLTTYLINLSPTLMPPMPMTPIADLPLVSFFPSVLEPSVTALKSSHLPLSAPPKPNLLPLSCVPKLSSTFAPFLLTSISPNTTPHQSTKTTRPPFLSSTRPSPLLVPDTSTFNILPYKNGRHWAYFTYFPLPASSTSPMH